VAKVPNPPGLEFNVKMQLESKLYTAHDHLPFLSRCLHQVREPRKQ